MIKILLPILLLSPLANAQVQTSMPSQTAIIVSGGQDMEANAPDFIADLDRATAVFSSWNRSTFYADGGDPKGLPNLEKLDADNNPIDPIDGVYPRYTRVLPKAPVTGPASYSNIADQLRKRVSDMEKNSATDSPIVLYFTDHGGLDVKTGKPTIELWNDESLTVEQLKSLLSLIPQTHTVEIIDDHCYGGAMAAALFDENGKPRSNACAVSPASALEESINGQGWMTVAKELKTKSPAELKKFDLDHDGFISAHEVLAAMPLLKKMHSLPTSSSDAFAALYLAQVEKEKVDIKAWNDSVCSNDLSKDAISKLFSNSLLPLAKEVLNHYRQDLSTSLSAAGLDNPASFSDLKDKVQAGKKNLDQKMLEDDAAGDSLVSAKTAFLRQKMGDKQVDALNALSDKVDDIQTKLDLATSDADKIKLRADLKSAQNELAPYNLTYNSIWDGLDNGNVDFVAFVQKNGDVPPNDFHKDVIDASFLADKTVDYLTDQLRPLERASRDLTTLTALESMSDRKDTTALNEYLGMLQCENIPIFRVPQ